MALCCFVTYVNKLLVVLKKNVNDQQSYKPDRRRFKQEYL